MKMNCVISLLALCMVFFACSCSDDISSGTSEDVSYKNPYKIEQMKEALYSGDNAKVKQIGDEIINMYPNTVDSMMAESYLKIIQSNEKSDEENSANIDFKNYIQLYSIKTSKPNSAGGIDLFIKWKNTSQKIVKYANFKCELYNAVDDIVSDDITGNYTFKGKVTGPIQPGEIYGTDYYWQNAWWNHSGKYAKIIEIKLEYMDGEKIEIPTNRIDELFY